LRITERTAFSEVRVPVGPAWVVGFQTEGLLATTSGWEFLLADHRTGRISGGATWARAGWSAGLRADVVHRSGGGHEEPLYGPDGEVVGTDVRAAPYRKNFTGATATLHRAGAAGEATVVEPAAMQVAIPAVVMESEPMVVVGMVAEARAEEVTDVAVRVVLQEVARGAEMVEGTEVVATVVAGMAAVVTAAAIEPLST
jgi:hypothetical protein